MTRHLSLTLLLMAGSVAAAMAAPEIGLRDQREECLETRALARDAWSAAPFLEHRGMPLPVVAGAVDHQACTFDVTEPYRLWHHGSAKMVPGCGTHSST